MAPDEPTRIHDQSNPAGGGPPIAPLNPDLMIGRLLNGAYRIEGKVGEGGMGVVYRATQVALGRPVAVKMIHVGSRVPASGVERFFREARLLSQLHHPNIVHIIDFGTEPGPLHFMVMEFLAGEPVDAFVARQRRLSPEVVLDLMDQVCAAMTAAHAQGIIHRDLKPSNVFVVSVTGSPQPVIKVLDFGLGKDIAPHEGKSSTAITREGIMMGTSGYSAPEQMHGGPADARADVYSLGALLYFLVAGRAPYRDEGLRSTLVKQLTGPPDPIDPDPGWPDLPRVEAVIHRAMSVRPAERPSSPAELFRELAAALRPGETVPEGPTPQGVSNGGLKGQPPARRRRRWWLAAGVAVALVAAGLVGWLLSPCNAGATAPGVTAHEVRFGFSGPFTGRNRQLGLHMKTGILTRFAVENDRGGVYCRKLVLIDLDDGYDPARARQNVEELVEQHQVFSFVGNVGTPAAREALPIATTHYHRLYFAPLTGGRVLRKDPPSKWVFNYRASYDQETACIVRYLVGERNLAPTQIAVFSQNDAYGDDGFEGVVHALRPYKVRREQILHVRYERDSPDLAPAVKAIVAARDRIKAVVMVTTYNPGSAFIKQVRDAGLLDLVFTNMSFVGSDDLAAKLRAMKPRARYCKGVIVTQVVPLVSSDASGVEEYRRHLAQYFPDELPNPVSLEGYVAASLLIEGLKRAGSKLTPESLIDALEQFKGLDLGIGAAVTFTRSEHQGSSKVWGSVLDEYGVYQELDLD
jgi:serine/threonine protein kinase/ABC-type branched-subunit amino acid transport system substrate-binding protein